MKNILLFLAVLMSLGFISCSENSLSSEMYGFSKTGSSSFYLLKGHQVTERGCYASSCEIARDTLKTSFLVQVIDVDKQDKVLFSGLEGADTAVREMPPGFNGGPPATPNCFAEYAYRCASARKTGNELEFELGAPGGYYSGTGSLVEDRMTLRTRYYYRGNGAEYILEGKKLNPLQYPKEQYERLFVYGKKVTTTYSDWPIPEGDKPTVDTSGISFIMLRQIKKYSFQIYGLEGADVGKRDNLVFPNCTDMDECKIRAKITGQSKFKINLNNEGRTYKATGQFRKVEFLFGHVVDLTMEAEYQYQNLTIKYELGGERW